MIPFLPRFLGLKGLGALTISYQVKLFISEYPIRDRFRFLHFFPPWSEFVYVCDIIKV